MGRSRRQAVDNDNGWALRYYYLADGVDQGDGVVDHADGDYVTFTTDGTGDDFGALARTLYTSPTAGGREFTVWGKGVVSLGKPTQEQLDFMAAADASTDLASFPGVFIEIGYQDPAATDIYVGIRNPNATGLVNAYTQINFNGTALTIYGDRIEIRGDAASIHLGPGADAQFDSTTGLFRLAGLIHLDGTTADDIITSTEAPQTIHGLGGNDTLTAGISGSDLYGDEGSDKLTGGIGGDRLFGGDGNDTIKGGIGDLLDGGVGNDTLIVDRSATIIGGDGIDRLRLDYTGLGLPFDVSLADGPSGTIASVGITYSGIERFDIIGGYGNDTLRGNSGVNVIQGGAGADIIDGGAGSDTLDAGVGGPAPELPLTNYGSFSDNAVAIDAAFSAKPGGDPQVILEFNEPADAFIERYYTVQIEQGGHIVVGSSDSLPMADGYGIFLLDADLALVATNEAGFPLDVSDLPAGKYYIEINTDNPPFSDQLSQAYVSLSTAVPIERHNILSGGTGNDTFLVHQADDVVIEKANEGTDTVIADINYVLAANVEALTLKAGAGDIGGTGNSLANVITGNEGANTLNGGDGADTLIGGGGVDLLIGSKGADRMEGGAGNDAYRVENSGDIVVEKAGEGIDKVFSTITYALTANVENLVLTGTAAINGTGNALANQLTGNSGANVLDGGAGIDTMLGGAGDDTYRVDDRSDRIYETVTAKCTLDAGGTDTVISTATYTLDASGRQFVENLVLSGSTAINGTGNDLANRIDGNNAANILTGGGGSDTLVGYNGDDRLYGGAGNDVLIAGAGNDRLDPGSGRDTMTGAAGADLFIFTMEVVLDAQTTATADRISDFSHAEGDRIDLRQIDANLLLTGDQAFTFIGTAGFSGHAGELRFMQTSSATFLVGDLNGDGVGDGFIRLGAGLTLVAADFLL